MPKLTPTLPLGGFTKNWTDFSIIENYGNELVSIACILGQETAFSIAFKKTFGKSPPKPNQMVSVKGGLAMWTSQSQYMLLLSGENIQADIDIAAKLNGSAYTTLQSDGWASLDIRGVKSFDVLERFISLNLRRMPFNFATRTSAHHIAVIVLKFNETEFQLLTPRSSAQSFVNGLVHTAENVLRAA